MLNGHYIASYKGDVTLWYRQKKAHSDNTDISPSRPAFDDYGRLEPSDMLTSRKVTIIQELAIMCIHIATVSDETFEGENLHDFYSIVNVLHQIFYYKKLLPQNFSHEISFYILTTKVFPLECTVYMVYGVCTVTLHVNLRSGKQKHLGCKISGVVKKNCFND